MTCRGFIYHTVAPTPCKNKAKDEFGYCLKHQRQSKTFQRQRELCPGQVTFHE